MMWNIASKRTSSDRNRSHQLGQAEGTYAVPVEQYPTPLPVYTSTGPTTTRDMPVPFQPIGAPFSSAPTRSPGNYAANTTYPGFHPPATGQHFAPSITQLPSLTSTASHSSYALPPYSSAQRPHSSRQRSMSPYHDAMPSPAVHVPDAAPPSPGINGTNQFRNRSRSPADAEYFHNSTYTVTTRIRRNSHTRPPQAQVLSSAPALTPAARPRSTSMQPSRSHGVKEKGRERDREHDRDRDREHARQQQREQDRHKLTKPPTKPHRNSISDPQTTQHPNKTHKYVHPANVPGDHNVRFKYSACTGRKRALCIGINYENTPRALLGCVNDARNVRRFLIKYHHFAESDVVLLTDDSSSPRSRPTRENLIAAMHWLVRDACPDDSLFFHYSGHGAQVPDKDGDEDDGMDEIIFPLDYKRAGYILDDEMHAIMVRPLPIGCRLTALFDSCHSGTVLDLPYMYHSDGRLKGLKISAFAHERKLRASGADVISFSGCKDSGTSADTVEGGLAVGAMSYAFMLSLKQEPNQTFQGLLKSVRRTLRDKYDQKPQLSSSHKIDISLKFVL